MSEKTKTIIINIADRKAFLKQCILQEKIWVGTNEPFKKDEKVAVVIRVTGASEIPFSGFVQNVVDGEQPGIWLILDRRLSGDAYDMVSKQFEKSISENRNRDEGPIIGVDLGTTNTLAAIYDKKTGPKLIFNSDGSRYLPSVVAFDQNWKKMVGQRAKDQLVVNPDRSIFGAKRLMGRKFRSLKDKYASFFPYNLVEGEDGEVAIKLSNMVVSIPWVSALILNEIKDNAERVLGQTVTQAIVSVPAHYNENQRKAVKKAGKIIGLNILKVINEPTAAVMAYRRSSKDNNRILVYDLGGGTFDVSIVVADGPTYEVICTDGDTFLGGDDFDQRIVNRILSTFKEKTSIDLSQDRVALQRIKTAAEQAKCELSEKYTAEVSIPFITYHRNQPIDIRMTLTRKELEDMVIDLVYRTIDICEKAMISKSITIDDIDEILLVGGQTRMPLVGDLLQRYFKKKVSRSIHPEEAVALGAAIYSDTLQSFDSVVLMDVLSIPIGIELMSGRYKTIIEKNTLLPYKKVFLASTTYPNQKEIKIKIYQGDHSLASNNEFLGVLSLKNLKAGKAGEFQFEVTFILTEDCLLKVKVEELTSGQIKETELSSKDVSVNIAFRPSGGNAIPETVPRITAAKA